MKFKFASVLAGVLVLASALPGLAEPTNSVMSDLSGLVSRINAKIQSGKRTEQDLSSELKEFDALLDKHKGEDAEQLTQILSMKGALYLQVFEEPEKAAEVFKQVKEKFPQTKLGQHVDQILEGISHQVEMKKVQENLAVGKPFPDFNEQDLAGKPLSLSGLKGKVVLLDFWATWCGPCRIELPNVIETFKKHHADGFEIVGISLDEKKPVLESFLKEKEMTWPQFFDGNKWQNKLAVKYGITSIPATYLIDGNGKIIGRDLRGEELEQAVTAALAKK